MHGVEGGEERAVMAAKVAIEPGVRLDAEELAGDLHREHLAVGEPRRGAALAQARAVQHRAERVVDQAVDGDEEGLEGHGRLRLPVSSLGRPLNASGSLPWPSNTCTPR